MRIAFFGGSFDPPHAGHLRIAHAAAERLQLDRILLAPVGLQPLKREGPPPASYDDRLAMLRLLLADDARSGQARNLCIEVSELDAPRTDGCPNYTFDTLLQLRTLLTSSDTLFMLLGADSFLTMRSWHRSAELLLLARWIVASRPGFSLLHIDRALPPSIRPTGPAQEGDRWLAQELAAADGRTTTLYLLPDLCEDISATAVRASLAENFWSLASSSVPTHRRSQFAMEVLAPSVIDYIRAHGLYR